jgi:hypothetical protein
VLGKKLLTRFGAYAHDAIAFADELGDLDVGLELGAVCLRALDEQPIELSTQVARKRIAIEQENVRKTALTEPKSGCLASRALLFSLAKPAKFL